jgi:rhamnulokinase
MGNLTVAATDLGAESGRVARVDFDGSELELSVVRRFPHSPTEHNGRSHWNLDFLWSEISHGLSELGSEATVRSVGVDTFGVDYGIFDAAGALIENPLTYREAARSDAFERVVATLGREELYQHTGSQVAPINTLFALAADQHLRPELLRDAAYFLMLADVFHHKLSGSSVTEYTMVSTSGIYDMARGDWAWDLIEMLSLPRHLFPEVAKPGTKVGRIIGDLATGGLSATEVILPAAHDTASAVVSIPDVHKNCMFISSGTWSLVGIVTPSPVISADTFRFNLTNEAGFPDNIRLLRNLMGLWMLQECRRSWASQGDTKDYPDLVALAAKEPALRSLVDPADNAFLAPGDMPRRIQDYCEAAGYPVPETQSQIVRTIIDSLAMSYRITVEDLEQATGTKIESVRVVGGGVNNALLQQATADATGLPVIAGAAEATVLGNAAVQLIALGELQNIEDAWSVISRSVDEKTYFPENADRYAQAAHDFRGLASKVAARSKRQDLASEPLATQR